MKSIELVLCQRCHRAIMEDEWPVCRDCHKPFRLDGRLPRVVAFLETIVALERATGLSLAHEDSQGVFIVHEYDDADTDWLMHARDEVKS